MLIKKIIYEKNPSKCKYCNKILTYDDIKNKKIFCSRSCAAKFNNRSRLCGEKTLFEKFMSISDEQLLKLGKETNSFNEFCYKNAFENFSKSDKENAKKRFTDLNFIFEFDKQEELIEKDSSSQIYYDNGKTIGIIGESKFIYECSLFGINISKPLSENSPYDFIIDINNKLYKIQVKTISDIDYRNGSQFSLVRSKYDYNTKKYIKYGYNENEVDYFYCYNVGIATGYLIKNDGIKKPWIKATSNHPLLFKNVLDKIKKEGN